MKTHSPSILRVQALPERSTLRRSRTSVVHEIRFDPAPHQTHEIQLVTAGILKLETSADVTEPGVIYLPEPEGNHGAPPASDGAEIGLFCHDAGVGGEWELVIGFRPDNSGEWHLNVNSATRTGAIAAEVVIPVDALEVGENLLHWRGRVTDVPTLYYRRRVEAAEAAATDGGSIRFSVTPGNEGEVRLVIDGETRATATFTAPLEGGVRGGDQADRPWEDRPALEEALAAVADNLCAAQIEQRSSRFDGGFHLVYDCVRHAPRMSHWLWAWGPSIRLLLEASRRARELGRPENGERWQAVARKAGRKSLEFEVGGTTHPARGLSTVRWEPARATSGGWAGYISAADTLFLAGWGWIPLYQDTGDAVYLERTRSLIAATGRLMDEYPVVPQDWIVPRGRWTPHTLDETAFGVAGFRALHDVEPAPEVAAQGRRLLDSMLAHMTRDEACVQRAWLREEDKPLWAPDIKGHGWVMMGYLDAHALGGDSRHLALARALGDRVRGCQADSGAWTYAFRCPREDDVLDDKATAIWAYLFYALYAITRDGRDLEAARRALAWCWRHQYRGDHPMLDGAIVNTNAMIYIHRRPMAILYSTTFFGLALLEELKLGTTGRGPGR